MKTHRTDLVSLIPGLLLVAVAVGALTDNLDIDLVTAEWAWPALLVALGLVVLASAGRRRRDDEADGPAGRVEEPTRAAPADEAHDVDEGDDTDTPTS